MEPGVWTVLFVIAYSASVPDQQTKLISAKATIGQIAIIVTCKDHFSRRVKKSLSRLARD